MKKLFVLLLIGWLLIGRMPLDKWLQIKDTDSYLQGIGFVFSQIQQCDSEIMAIGEGEFVVILGQCAEPKPEPKKEARTEGKL